MSRVLKSSTSLLLCRVIVLTICAPAVFLAQAAMAAELVWDGDFETGDLSQYQGHLYEEGTVSSSKIVTSPVRAGKYAAELMVEDIEPTQNRVRAEIMTLMNSGGRMQFEWDGPEYWIGFSFLFKERTASTSTFFQIHAPNEPKGDPCDFAGNTFTVGGSGAEIDGFTKDIVVRVIENGGVSTGKGSGSNNTVVHKYPLPLNEWQDFVVNFKLSTGGKGFYKLWKNGKQVYTAHGLTNVNYRDSCGNLIPKDQRKHNGAKLGIYGSGSVTGLRRIYFDEVRIAEGRDGYDLVSPSGSRMSDADELPPPNPPAIKN